MPDGITLFLLALTFGLVLIAGSALANDSTGLLNGLFASQAVRDWPSGIQEADAPRFDVAHVDLLRQRALPAGEDALEPADIVELFDRPL